MPRVLVLQHSDVGGPGRLGAVLRDHAFRLDVRRPDLSSDKGGTPVPSSLEGYDGPVAVMSFNPHSMAVMQRIAPDVPRGLVTESFQEGDWPVPSPTLQRLRDIPDYDHVGACFISHEAADLDRARVTDLNHSGAHVFCWKLRSKTAEIAAREVADNVTFEGYLA